MRKGYLISILILLVGWMEAYSQNLLRLEVSHDGSRPHQSVQGAINAIPAAFKGAVLIFIHKGVYREKLYIERANITLEGADRTGTVITASIARDEWRCQFNDDWGVATLNVAANDITLRNLTIENSFGFEFKQEYSIPCRTDTVTGNKKIAKNGHQMALRTMNATRLKAINCHFKSFGGDTVSPWEVYAGMWYFKDCLMEGSVDLYCPRGWAWAENCEFKAHSGTAIIWHDGSQVEDSKTVLKNCRFSGYDGFLLGRFHRDAQFYLIDCEFANNMRDSAIYRVPTSNVIRWGTRTYYYNCHRPAGDYKWFANNISAEKAKAITVNWVFGDKWNPLNL
jgi:pectinesterase